MGSLTFPSDRSKDISILLPRPGTLALKSADDVVLALSPRVYSPHHHLMCTLSVVHVDPYAR